MSHTDPGDPREGTQRRRPARGPGVGDLTAFRGRTTRLGAPVLPPAYRPQVDDIGLEPVRVEPMSAPVAGPPAVRVPEAAAAPDATVVPARTVGAEVRVVRRLRPWSVWKLSLAFSICMVAVFATAAALLWAVASALGALDRVERLIEDMGFESFNFDGSAMLTALVVGGVLASLALSVLAGVLTVMFNLLSDLTGGLETETSPKPRSARARRRQARKADRAERKRTRKADRHAGRAGTRRSRRRRRPKAAEPDEPAVAGVEAFPSTPEILPRNGVSVEPARRNGRPDLDLTGDEHAVEEVDHIQRALDDLLADLAPPPPDADED